MKAIIVPVKAFASAKSRLAPDLSRQARAGLAAAMCADVFAAVKQVRVAHTMFVVSNEPFAIEQAQAHGWEALVETRQTSESASVDAACRHCELLGYEAALRLPVDIPLVRSEDIEAVFDSLTLSPGCVIVPSLDGTGTNALLRSPPTAFPSRFGKDSFPKHVAAARAADIPLVILENANIALDIDNAADLALLRERVAPASETAKWFNETDRVPLAGSDRAPFLRPPQG